MLVDTTLDNDYNLLVSMPGRGGSGRGGGGGGRGVDAGGDGRLEGGVAAPAADFRLDVWSRWNSYS